MIIEGNVLAVPHANVDTDQIIPAHYLTGIDSTGMGAHLFEGMPDGAELLASRPGAPIMVTRENFGCGSSREHAAWALLDRGFNAVIAPSFARIFHENAYNNALVPVILPAETCAALESAQRIEIDVDNETLRADGGEPISFALDPLRKQFILGGGFLPYLAGKIPEIRAWQASR